MTDTPGAMPAPKTNTLAIVALVCAVFCFPLIGAVLGYVARNQIRESGEGGEGLATAAIYVGVIFTVLYALYWFVALA